MARKRRFPHRGRSTAASSPRQSRLHQIQDSVLFLCEFSLCLKQTQACLGKMIIYRPTQKCRRVLFTLGHRSACVLGRRKETRPHTLLEHHTGLVGGGVHYRDLVLCFVLWHAHPFVLSFPDLCVPSLSWQSHRVSRSSHDYGENESKKGILLTSSGLAAKGFSQRTCFPA